MAAVVSALWAGAPVHARGPVDNGSTVALATLPPEAQQTQRLIHAGGPFPYAKDGSVFGNRERLLPAQARGFYREYTVPTPGSRDRGARRIVCGGRQSTQPEACYYTADHYASFQLIAP
ncbi:ribonuclease [Ideonella sp. DXS22W]|uniref:Ribonuclease n=1 Tax=Pseudaquabacterium inlustre TaxID=2984192 RepID=A0ABU9CIQ7_9BURK